MQIATSTQTPPVNRDSIPTKMVTVVLLVGVATVQDGRAWVLCKIQLELIQKFLPK